MILLFMWASCNIGFIIDMFMWLLVKNIFRIIISSGSEAVIVYNRM